MKTESVVITGSTRGIGLGLAKEFLKQGYQVVINGRTDEKVNQIINELKEISPNITGLSGDVSKEEVHEQLFNHAVSNFGKVDIWINNAGIPQPHINFIDIDSEDIKNTIETNIFGLMLGTKVAANRMIKQGFGKIFNMEGFGSNGRMMNKLTLYGSTKRTVNYFTKSVAKELKNSPIQIGGINPGMVRTDFLHNSEKYMSNDELKRFKKVYDIMAEDVNIVTKFLVNKIIHSSKDYNQIKFLTKTKLATKIFKMMINIS